MLLKYIHVYFNCSLLTVTHGLTKSAHTEKSFEISAANVPHSYEIEDNSKLHTDIMQLQNNGAARNRAKHNTVLEDRKFFFSIKKTTGKTFRLKKKKKKEKYTHTKQTMYKNAKSRHRHRHRHQLLTRRLVEKPSQGKSSQTVWRHIDAT